MSLDFRSDTVTRPTKEMKEAMMMAPLGDDVFGDDPTVNLLEKKVAELFGHEAALFCPSGTMSNQIAIKVHTNSPAEVICSNLAHIYRYEGGGIAFNSAASVRLIPGERGLFTLEDIKNEINPDDIHFPPSQLVSIENTSNKGGGCCWDNKDLEEIHAFCKEKQIPLHLDGARIFNALVAKGTSSKEMGRYFESISICLSKGLGAPVGSVLLGNQEFIKKSRRIRKLFGGGMRQAGIIAAAGIYALDHHVDRLAIDHKNAKKIAFAFESSSSIKQVLPVETNIVIVEFHSSFPLEKAIALLNEKGILVSGMGKQLLRFVCHLDQEAEDIEYTCEQIKNLFT